MPLVCPESLEELQRMLDEKPAQIEGLRKELENPAV